MSIPSALISAISSALPNVLPHSETPPAPNPLVSGPLPGTDRVLLSPQPLPPAPTPSPAVALGANPGVIVPFQWKWQSYDGGQAGQTKTQTFSGNTVLKNVTKHFRDAALVQLELVVYPYAPTLKEPRTVHVAWTSAEVELTADQVLSTPGAVSLTVGGLYLLNSGVVPCDLSFVNPIVKSPITYSNTPKVHVYYPDSVPDSGRRTYFSIILRGSLRLSSPILAPHS